MDAKTVDTLPVVSKTKIMQLVFDGICHECFSHSTEGLFDVTLMREFALQNPTKVDRWKAPLNLFLDHLRENYVFEGARVAELSEVSWQSDPGLIVLFSAPDDLDTTLIIDGVHRAMRREAEGQEDMEFFVFDESQIIRPAPGFVENPFADWGDKVVDGKIVKRA